MATIQVKPKSVSGRVYYYPVGENATHVLLLIKKKTLSELELDAFKALGVSVEKLPQEKGN